MVGGTRLEYLLCNYYINFIQIKVELNDVDIEPSSHPRKCLFDRLEFAELGKIPTQICRHQYTDKTVVSYRDKATLSFETDDSVTARGFSAIVSCVRK